MSPGVNIQAVHPACAVTTQGRRNVAEHKVEAVERALTVVEAFNDGSVRLSLAELAHRTGLYRSTILRLAGSLERFGYLTRDADGHFRLGPSLWRLGTLYQNAFHLADYVRPALQQLVDEVGETAAFYVREGDRRVCLYRTHGPRLIRAHVEEGAELPLDRGASARILTAYTGGEGEFYEQIRKEGHYISLGERDPETAAIAVPVFRSSATFVGALGVTGSLSRMTTTKLDSIREVLVASAERLSRILGA